METSRSRRVAIPVARVAKRRIDAPEHEEIRAVPDLAQRCARVSALLRGEPKGLDDVTLDMEGVPDFNRRVYEVARTIPWGATLSYGEIAKRLGDPGVARDVGQALGQNPFAIVVPCHRVLAAGGKWGGFSARGGVSTKRRLLSIEAAQRPLLDD